MEGMQTRKANACWHPFLVFPGGRDKGIPPPPLGKKTRNLRSLKRTKSTRARAILGYRDTVIVAGHGQCKAKSYTNSGGGDLAFMATWTRARNQANGTCMGGSVHEVTWDGSSRPDQIAAD